MNFLNLEFLSSSPKFLKRLLRQRLFVIPWVIYVNLRVLLQKPGFYGQLNEDQEILQWCPESEGMYIDIGAGYPVRGSNSFYFYKKGWKGICIEPISTSCRVFKMFRKRDFVLNTLVGSENKSAIFFLIEPYEYSTTSPEIAHEILQKTEARLVKKIKRKQIRLDSLNISLTPAQPSFITIDVEGADLEVLKSNDWNRIRPRVLVVEEWSDKSNMDETVTDFLDSKGYMIVKNLSPSLVFVEKEWAHTYRNLEHK